MATKTDMDKLSFEEALKSLEEIVARLESGRVELEESIAIYERGAALKAHCERKLKDAENNYIWMPGIAQGRPNTIDGDPYVEASAMPNEGAGLYPPR